MEARITMKLEAAQVEECLRRVSLKIPLLGILYKTTRKHILDPRSSTTLKSQDCPESQCKGTIYDDRRYTVSQVYERERWLETLCQEVQSLLHTLRYVTKISAEIEKWANGSYIELILTLEAAYGRVG